MTHQRIILRPSGPTIDGGPGLPAELRNLSDETLADIEAACDPCPDHLIGIGYWRILPPGPVPDGHVETGRALAIVPGETLCRWVLRTEPAPPAPLPPLSGRQIRLALRNIGITPAMVDAQIEAHAAALIADAGEIEDEAERQAAIDQIELDRDLALIDWRDASQYQRSYPLLNDMAEAFDLAPEHVDALWEWAAGL